MGSHNWNPDRTMKLLKEHKSMTIIVIFVHRGAATITAPHTNEKADEIIVGWHEHKAKNEIPEMGLYLIRVKLK